MQPNDLTDEILIPPRLGQEIKHPVEGQPQKVKKVSSLGRTLGNQNPFTNSNPLSSIEEVPDPLPPPFSSQRYSPPPPTTDPIQTTRASSNHQSCSEKIARTCFFCFPCLKK